MALREGDLTIDLESGAKIVKEEAGNVEPSSIKREVKNIFWGRLTEDTLPRDERAAASSSYVANIIRDASIKLLIDKNLKGEEGRREVVANVEKKNDRGKHNNKKKAPKPPRPPKGPSLDAADQMLVKEIAELAMKKRSRIERMKVLKKAKAEKTSSCNTYIPALIITCLFFLVVIVQSKQVLLDVETTNRFDVLMFLRMFCSCLSTVISSRSSSLFQGSPEPAVGGSSGFISVQYIMNFPRNESYIPNSTTSVK
ncbi:uncharacterized protein LOC111778230 isoform X1 [Cucurbita pepo subsp. pepo]|uniref:uncharacterized protein LOC111778230 isoform X1 n=1 Tax=Cucurbita pepo subsp. pepo TaxID=3664 RepID=UPI000C9D92C0|nr:uncharacterized protein LOC111778230 isoform X1 [Cucurbita pepo subsp. pepo]